MDTAPAPIITLDRVILGQCSHCDAQTVQVVGGSGVQLANGQAACLQCLADGGGCCSLRPLDRRNPAQ